MAFARQSRVMKELRMLQQSPAPGISCWQSGSENEESRSSDTENSLEKLEAAITGPDGTPYEGGIFQVGIQIGSRYPFEPPKCRFKTKIYHPNVDDAGRICLDLLKMPPAGAWRPAINIATLLKSLQLLLSQPNPDDALVPDIAMQYQSNRQLFETTAKEYTCKYAKSGKEAEPDHGRTKPAVGVLDTMSPVDRG